MFRLLDRTFWRFFAGFVVVLLVCFSLLMTLEAFRGTRENIAAFVRGALDNANR